MRQPNLLALIVELKGHRWNVEITSRAKDDPHFQDQAVGNEDNIGPVGLHPCQSNPRGEGVALQTQVIYGAIGCVVHIHFFAHQRVLSVPQADLFDIRAQGIGQRRRIFKIEHGTMFDQRLDRFQCIARMQEALALGEVIHALMPFGIRQGHQCHLMAKPSQHKGDICRLFNPIMQGCEE